MNDDADLLSQSVSLEEEARQLRKATDKKITRATNEFRILSVLMLCALTSLGVLGYFLFQQSHDAAVAAKGAKQAVAGTNANQRDLDDLVSFVEELRLERAEDDNDGPSETEAVFKAVYEIRTIVCASQDPARQATCRQLGG